MRNQVVRIGEFDESYGQIHASYPDIECPRRSAFSAIFPYLHPSALLLRHWHGRQSYLTASPKFEPASKFADPEDMRVKQGISRK